MRSFVIFLGIGASCDPALTAAAMAKCPGTGSVDVLAETATLDTAAEEAVTMLQSAFLRHTASHTGTSITGGQIGPELEIPVSPCQAAKPLSDIRGKSIYFVLVDRFARSHGDETACAYADNNWCNGTLQGITRQLDYIQGMGFDCIWITPVLKQFEGLDGSSGYGSHGYWAYDWYEIDSHYGTKEDLKNLSAELHKRKMCFVYDVVANHVGPIHGPEDVAKVRPFNKVEHYHISNIQKMASASLGAQVDESAGWLPPVQGISTGAQCAGHFNSSRGCNCFKCPVDSDHACPSSHVWDEKGPCPRNAIFPFCMAGDFECVGYNATVTHEGWFYDLGDLNQSNPFVHEHLLRWARHMVEAYSIDAIRLDTASYMPLWFLRDLQESVCVPILGEATVTNVTFHAQFQANPPRTGTPVLKGVLNFPLTYAAVPGICGPQSTHWPYAEYDLRFLGQRIHEQLEGPYVDLDFLGNQVDNHDMDRIAKACKGDASRIRNLIAWNMLSRGIPIIYYGTEVGESGQRNSLWQYGWKTDAPLYRYLALLNAIRRHQNIGTLPMHVAFADPGHLVFTRGRSMWVYLNNFGDSLKSVTYCKAPTSASAGTMWVNALDGDAPVMFTAEGCLVAGSSLPVVLVRKGVASEEGHLQDHAHEVLPVQQPG